MLLLAIATFVFALFTPAKTTWWKDYWHLLTHQTYLIHDFFEVAGPSATFVNLALHFGVAYYLNVRNNLTHLTGFQLAAIGIFAGHSLFGTHLLNILPIILGVILYARKSGQSFKLYTSVSLFATCTAPTVSYLMFASGGLLSVLTGFIFGIGLGFITPPLAEDFLKFHQGYTLYNIGFTGGVIGLFSYACLRYFGLEIPSAQLVSTTAHNYILVYLISICLLMLILATVGLDDQDFKTKFIKLNRRVGRLPDDFVIKYGRRTTFFNMGLLGMVYLSLLLVLGIRLNGPTAGGLLSVIGFAGFGKHLRNTLPIAAGIILAAYFSDKSFASIGFALSLLFGTSLAPIAGYYGILVGMIAGFLQFNVAQSVIDLHLGLSLYNNGFSSGFVAAFMIPVLENFNWRKASSIE
ncbi:DUF1576 domain-containing protein [Streptococcus ovuberis]|uniref:DUF1576 domain-containing protein n=1 Tax=Streptococcus ovuberis TaxID=1936207 RepID=A0A7X6MZ92_9STRE|nr:DUF1576 domain-containing protein [Streptococcus ovuberis]